MLMGSVGYGSGVPSLVFRCSFLVVVFSTFVPDATIGMCHLIQKWSNLVTGDETRLHKKGLKIESPG
jgi:hypothetical protein